MIENKERILNKLKKRIYGYYKDLDMILNSCFLREYLKLKLKIILTNHFIT